MDGWMDGWMDREFVKRDARVYIGPLSIPGGVRSGRLFLFLTPSIV
jgi:hypothetical protein